MANISKKRNEARIAAELKDLKTLCGKLSESNQKYVLAVAQALKFSEREEEGSIQTEAPDSS